MTLVPHNYSPEILQPADQPLNLPSASVSAQNSAVLGLGLGAVAPVRSYHLDALLLERLVKRITVVRSVSDEPMGTFRHKPCLESMLHKGDFMRRSTLNVDGEWKRSAVCNDHDLRTFAPLGLSNTAPPFFATTKVPSMKHSDRSMSPRSCRSWANACNTRSSTLVSTHRWKRRWQVWYGGYRSGKSFQGAPVRRIHKMPLSTSRVSRQGRPLPSARRGGCGISGSKTAHCSSVKSNFVSTPEVMMVHFSVGYL